MKRIWLLFISLIVFVGQVIFALPAQAACHIAGFEPATYTTAENAGSVKVKVVLEGRQPYCAGSVNYATEPGTAESGKDYTHVQGTLQFISGDDREEEITIPILDDTGAEAEEKFQIRLSAPSGAITGTRGPASVTISENDGAAPAPARTSPAAKGKTSPAPSPSSSPSPSLSPSPSPSVSPSPSPSPTPRAMEEVESQSERSVWPLVLGTIALLTAAATGGWLLWRKRA